MFELLFGSAKNIAFQLCLFVGFIAILIQLYSQFRVEKLRGLIENDSIFYFWYWRQAFKFSVRSSLKGNNQSRLFQLIRNEADDSDVVKIWSKRHNITLVIAYLSVLAAFFIQVFG